MKSYSLELNILESLWRFWKKNNEKCIMVSLTRTEFRNQLRVIV